MHMQTSPIDAPACGEYGGTAKSGREPRRVWKRGCGCVSIPGLLAPSGVRKEVFRVDGPVGRRADEIAMRAIGEREG